MSNFVLCTLNFVLWAIMIVMVPKTETAKDHILRIAGYVFLAISIATFTWLLVKFASGYNINPKTGEVFLSGLVLVETEPVRADIWVGEKNLKKRTPKQFTLPAGKHELVLKASGSREWKKTINLSASEVVWVNYAWLLPEELTSTSLLTFPKSSIVEQSPNQEQLLVGGSRPLKLELVDLEQDAPIAQPLELPAALVESLEEAEVSKITWAGDNRHVLVEFKSGDEIQRLVLDLRDLERSHNISIQFQLGISDIQFKSNDANRLYVLADNSLRLLDLDQNTVTGVLASNVVSFQSTNGFVSLIQEDKDKNQKKLAILDRNDKPVVVSSSLPTGKLILENGRLENTRIIVVASEDSLLTWVGPKPQAAPVIYNFQQTQELGFGSGGRYVFARADKKFLVYDFELGKIHRFVPSDQSLAGLSWIDDFHLAGVSGDKAIVFEFDGGNVNDITTGVSGEFQTLVNQDLEWHYSFKPAENDGVQLVRTNLLQGRFNLRGN